MEKFASQNKDIFKLLFETVSEGIVVVNKNRTIVASNTSANELFQYQAGELKGKLLEILIPDRYKHAHTKYASNFMKNQEKRRMGFGRDLYGKKKDGSEFPIEIGLNPIQLDGETYIMAMIIDISVRKKTELEIRELNSRLEDMVAKRTLQLQETVNNLKSEITKRLEAENRIKNALNKERELNDLKTKFLSMVSHEFKTPLSGILTSATLAGKYTQENQQDKRDKHLKTIKSKVKYLNDILTDFLSLEKIESGKVSYSFTQFPLSKVINEVIYESNMVLKNGQNIIYPENIDGIEINFDEKILTLALTNLVNNAIKYSEENSEINIQLGQDETDFYINIIDEGIGIPKEEQKFIFDRYFRAENALMAEGTGIGLNIIKNHLEHLQGKISFKSIENKGSTFTLKIPKNPLKAR
ncbi:PAS domain-containing sensor histidine kinase [Mesonia sp. HuA40]|uniref:PAS domain-containing sensor histidine kinase n=1 Tax=Mesonia sp. HuA40 TaxID=2602761 RepID=UPI0011CA2E30|nr:PAS domain-containing sensor histidine kinase [Mesonia sp. HuA40]TXK74213.1 PAS domain S-box protein [Mesonia sp. HuA40]